MTKPIVQSVTFKASPEELFAIFTDSEKLSAATGDKASRKSKSLPASTSPCQPFDRSWPHFDIFIPSQ